MSGGQFYLILTKGRLATWNIALAGYGGTKTVKRDNKETNYCF